jgi:outer membrane protein OmpA-like peptidoglycan-associated protein
MNANPLRTSGFVAFCLQLSHFGRTSLLLFLFLSFQLGLMGQGSQSFREKEKQARAKSNLLLDSTLSIDLSKYNSLFEQQKSLKVKLTYGTKGQLYDSIFRINFSDSALSQSTERTLVLPAKQMGIMAEVLEGIRFNYADLPLQSTLSLHLLHRPLAAMLADALKISLSEQGIENETLKLNLTYEKLPLERENVLKVKLDRLDLPHDSLFEIKLTYDRIGQIKDSLMIVKLSQIALQEDSIDEQLIFVKIMDYSQNEPITVELNLKAYESISKALNPRDLFSVYKLTYILSLNKKEVLSDAERKKRLKESFFFVGEILEEGSKVRLPNVRVVIRDKADYKKQFVEVTDAFGSFRDTVYGYELNSQLAFDIFLKKEGYVSKFVDFEEVLTEYGEVDLREYLERINLTKAAVGVEIGKAANLKPIYFDFDRSTIRPDAAKELDKLVEVLNDLPNVAIELSSHTDARSTDRYNMALSQRRANATTNYLISRGIDPDRIVAVGYGETQLVNECANGVDCPEEKHALNRRTEFEITSLSVKPKSLAKTIEAKKQDKPEGQKPPRTVSSRKDSSIKAISGRSLAEKEKQKRSAKIKAINVFCKVTDAKTGKTLSGVEVIVSDVLDARNVYTTKSNENGEFTLKIEDYQMGEKVYLDFLLSKAGYISKTYDYRGKITADFNSFINLNKLFEDVYLVAADLDIDIRKAANIPTIEFDLDQASISRASAIELDKIAAILVEQPNLKIEIRAHTDARGNDAYNLKLSQERAESTMNYLVSRGVSYSRITAKGFGEQKLVNRCANGVECSEKEHLANRRTEFLIR